MPSHTIAKRKKLKRSGKPMGTPANPVKAVPSKLPKPKKKK